MKIGDRIYPSLLVSESFYPYLDKEERLLEAVVRTLDEGYYQRIETGSVKNPKVRIGLRKLLECKGVHMTQWITNDMNQRHLNPSALDAGLRAKTVDAMKGLVDVAAESGADRMAFISGPDPGENCREESKKVLADVICQVTDKMKTYPGMLLLLEPLDRGTHKNQLLGPSGECVEVMKAVREYSDSCYLSWDSAHMALNEENLEESIEMCAPYIGHLHLANAVLEKGLPEYGDWHMAMGKPGFLDVKEGSRILQKAIEVIPKKRSVGVTIECRCREDENPFENEKACRSFLQEILDCPLGG